MAQAPDEITIFSKDEIVPDVVSQEPKMIAKVVFNKLSIDNGGKEMKPSQVSNHPSIDWNSEDDKYYTVIMTDPDAPSRNKPDKREWVHWAVGNIKGNDIKNGDTLIEYVGSAPPKGSGLHRYVILIYEQADKINKWDQEKLIAKGGKGEGRANWSAQKFVKNNKLGDLVAGNYYLAQWDDSVPKVYEMLAGK